MNRYIRVDREIRGGYDLPVPGGMYYRFLHPPTVVAFEDRVNSGKNFLAVIRAPRKLHNPLLVFKVIDSMEGKRYEPGSYIIKEGGAGDYFYVTGSGELEVRCESHARREYQSLPSRQRRNKNAKKRHCTPLRHLRENIA